MSYVNKNHIFSSVNILDVADEFNIKLEQTSSGNFDHRCRCPSSEHKHGSERTSSCYIDSVNNNFYCFGCSANYNVIDFYMLCSNSTFKDAFRTLSKRVDRTKISGKKTYSSKQNNYKILIEISSIIRKALTSAENVEDFDSFMKNVDSYIDKIPSDDIRQSKALMESVKKYLHRIGALK
tara:strand:+ start:975 stop:1514 length:540 start_codon:yes stop_codon:yes gene_type:complete